MPAFIDNIKRVLSHVHLPHHRKYWKYINHDALATFCVHWFGAVTDENIKTITHILDARWKELTSAYQSKQAYNIFMEEYARYINWKSVLRNTSLELSDHLLLKHRDKYNMRDLLISRKVSEPFIRAVAASLDLECWTALCTYQKISGDLAKHLIEYLSSDGLLAREHKLQVVHALKSKLPNTIFVHSGCRPLNYPSKMVAYSLHKI